MTRLHLRRSGDTWEIFRIWDASVCIVSVTDALSRERSAENDVMAANLIPGPTHNEILVIIVKTPIARSHHQWHSHSPRFLSSSISWHFLVATVHIPVHLLRPRHFSHCHCYGGELKKRETMSIYSSTSCVKCLILHLNKTCGRNWFSNFTHNVLCL